MTFDVETLQKQIPSYLTAAQQDILINELKVLNSGGGANCYLSRYHDELGDSPLQGDGWRGFVLFLFETGERRAVRGLVLSNSCDIDPENPRDLPTSITFAPLVKVSAFVRALEESNIDASRIEAKMASIRAQKTSNILYLPAGGELLEEYLVRFDQIHSMPMRAHIDHADREKIFRLSMTGFYLLTLKLSVHFCRMQEGINRNPPEAGAEPA